MCGIAGWIDYEADLSYRKNILEEMSAELAFRGPDSSGLWMSPHAAFAHRRLAVVDPAGGSQPMVRQKGNNKYIICYNGELYNTLDLRHDLECRGYSFQSSCDTEVLLTAYIEWGDMCVEYLNGIFAFAIWDETLQKLFLARDRFGVKPLFYKIKGKSLIFASELKALLVHPFVDSKVDSEGLAEIFALGPSRTPGHGVFKGVYELKPAYCAIYSNNGFRKWKYWSLESRLHEDKLEDTIEKVRGLVLDSIERQFVSDVPVCTFLSGGLDSSAITALAAGYFGKNGNNLLHTYSIDYVDNEKYFKASDFQPNPDAPYIKKMADEFNTFHHYITFDTQQLAESLTAAVDARDLPGMADVDASLWLFCREVKKDATVALSGECADEYGYSNTTQGCKKARKHGLLLRFLCLHTSDYLCRGSLQLSVEIISAMFVFSEN